MKRHDICAQVEQWLEELNKHQHIERSANRIIQMNYQDLRSHYKQLREELAKLKPPAGLEDLDRPFSAAVAATVNPPMAGTSSGTTTSAAATQPAPAALAKQSSSDESLLTTPTYQSALPKTSSPIYTADAVDGSSQQLPMPPPSHSNTTPDVVEADAPSDSSSTIENMVTDEAWWNQ